MKTMMQKRLGLFMGMLFMVAMAQARQLDANVMLQEVNKVRGQSCKCGNERQSAAPPLVWDDKLERAAQRHANDMARKKFFSHTGSDKSTVSSRVDKEKFVWMLVGENLADGYKSEADVVAGWMTSPGHCKNIMNPEFTHMGVAVSKDGRYWVQVFATPME
jgi:uncharacterized protein YkwD